jgi:rare lipoprotein A (peptidoglycan hydrolase)
MTAKNLLRTGLAAVAMVVMGTGCVAAGGSAFATKQTGGASHYDERSVIAFPGSRSSKGCAHRTLPAGTVVKVRYQGRYTTCVVDDRGPYVSGRILDLQPDQFDDLAPLSKGVLSGIEISW